MRLPWPQNVENRVDCKEKNKIYYVKEVFERYWEENVNGWPVASIRNYNGVYKVYLKYWLPLPEYLLNRLNFLILIMILLMNSFLISCTCLLNFLKDSLAK